MSKLLSIPLSHHFFSRCKKIIIDCWLQCINVGLQLTFPLPTVTASKIKQRVAMIKQWCWSRYLVCIIVYHKSEIAIMTISIANHSIKDNHVHQPIIIGISSGFKILNNCRESSRSNDTPYGDEGKILASKQIAS